MNKDKSTAIIYRDWSSIVLGLTPEKAGELFQGLFRRWADEPDGLDPTLKVILDYFETKIDENNAKHEEASQKRAEGRRKQAEELKALKDTSSDLKSIKKTSKNLTALKRPDTDTDTVTDTDTDTDTVTVNTKESEPKGSPKKGGLSLDQFNSVMSEFPVFENNKDLQKSLVSYLHMRKKRSGTSAVKTVDSLRKIINKAIKLGQGDPQNMIEIFDNSTAMSYQGLFVPDEQKARLREKSVTDIINSFGMEEDEASGR